MPIRTLADAAVVAGLAVRIARLTHDQARVWGTMTAHQMAVHLGDTAEAVLQRRDFTIPGGRPRPVMKWFALNAPIPWPRNIKTGAEPAAEPVARDAFEADRTRVLTTLEELAAAPAEVLVGNHPIFGPMTRADWHRWAFLHIDHHLRQFGL